MQTTTDPAQLFGADVLDTQGNNLGSVDGVWVDDATNDLEFIAVKTGGLFAKSHIVPVADAQIGDGTVTVPYAEDQIKDAPSFATDAELTPEDEDQIYAFFGIDRSTSASPSGLPSGTSGQGLATSDSELAGRATDDQAKVTLSEEELQVGKREVEAGRVRLRKVVNTEHQEVPVELRREDIEIERVPASNAGAPAGAFQEGEIEIPVMREEPVVGKEAHVTGAVRLSKTADTETRTVGGEVRKEDVEIDRDVDPTSSDRTY
jgi:uncharacterized protein (TIGR02271 family)